MDGIALLVFNMMVDILFFAEVCLGSKLGKYIEAGTEKAEQGMIDFALLRTIRPLLEGSCQCAMMCSR